MNRPTCSITSTTNTSPLHFRSRNVSAPASPLLMEKLDLRNESPSPRRRSSSGAPMAPSAEKSYLKCRRAQARNERRSNILNLLDRNLEELPLHPSSPRKTLARNASPGRFDNSQSSINKPTSTTTTATNSSMGSCSSLANPVHQKVNMPPQRRLTLMNFFRKDRGSNNSGGDGGSVFSGSVKSTRATSPSNVTAGRRARSGSRGSRRSATPEPVPKADQESVLQEQLIRQVLQQYPKVQCQTLADHNEFAWAELTRHSSTVHMTPEKISHLRELLESKVKATIEEDESIAESGCLADQQQQQQHKPKKQRSKGSADRPRGRNNSAGRSRKVANAAPARARTIVPPPEEEDEVTQRTRNASEKGGGESPLFVVKSSTKSLDARHPGSSKSMEAPLPPPASPGKSSASETRRSTSLKQNNNQEKQRGGSEVSTDSSTEAQDTSETLVPPKPSKRYVEELLLMDTAGNVGKYSGTISDKTGKPHGHGKMLYQTETPEKGLSYEGEWNQGQWNGKGCHVKHNGDVYEGYFCDDEKHGQGVYKYADGKRRFDGRYVMGHRVEGTMHYSDRSIYKGQWYNGKRQGRGIYQFSDKSKYKGEFDRDRIHGVGTLVWPDGSKYVGEWSHGQRHGMGKEYTKDGKIRYDGVWKNNKPVPSEAH